MKKDLAAKEMTKCVDVFSDICNVNLFGSEQRLRPEELELLPTELGYRDAEKKLREHRMDVRMRHRVSHTDISVFCLENQAGISNIMPIRDMGYVYSSYNEQIKKIRQKNEREGRSHYTEGLGKDQKLVPVISLVLYYGTEEWTAPTDVMGMLEIPEEWREILTPWIVNHSVRIVSVADQSEEIRNRYQSDFRHVADYLAYIKQKNTEKLQEFMYDDTRKIVHVIEFLDMLHAFSKDSRYLTIAEKFKEIKKEGDEADMCMLMDLAEEEGMKRGMEIGIERGIEQGLEQARSEDIKTLVESLRFFNIPEAAIVQQLIERYQLTPKEASEITCSTNR